MRILAVDPGSKNIGLAISDPSGSIANPLMIIKHKSREIDSDMIIEQAYKHDAGRIIIGQSFEDENGKPSFEGRKSERLAAAIRRKTTLPVDLWDESFSTQDARKGRIMMGVSRRNRAGHLDQLAAILILQSYLDAHLGGN
jgi:putative Holliday junction resolvase